MEECTLDDAVADFFLGTISERQRPRFISLTAEVVRILNESSVLEGLGCLTLDSKSLCTGSVSELYIDPPIVFTDDIDIMVLPSDVYIVPETEQKHIYDLLRDEPHVSICRMIETEWPNYVYVRVVGKLIKTSGRRRKFCKTTKKEIFLKNNAPGITFGSQRRSFEKHGPAFSTSGFACNKNEYKFPYPGSADLSKDIVPGIHCVVWPLQAADWPVRRRLWNWPSVDTIARIVDLGCDVVGIGHRLCRDDDKMWRISFSRAETMLLNSWTFEQQIVYHLFRFIFKDHRQQQQQLDLDTGGMLSNYHIKTLMMWLCETNGQDFWKSMNVVRLCLHAMCLFVECLEKRDFEHYFTKGCNLYPAYLTSAGQQQNDLDVIGTLKHFDCFSLSQLFFEKYIARCAEQCADYGFDTIIEQLENATSISQLQFGISCVVDCYRNMLPKLAFESFEGSTAMLTKTANLIEIQLLCSFSNGVTAADPNYADYIRAVIYLIIASDIERKCDVTIAHLAALIKERFDMTISSDSITSVCDVSLALLENSIDMMPSIDSSPDSELNYEIIKHCLLAVIELAGDRYDNIKELATAYLAALYFVTGDYDTVHKLCQCVLTAGALSQTECSVKFGVRQKLLSFLDHEIFAAFGLVQLYNYHVLHLSLDSSNYGIISPQQFVTFLNIMAIKRINSDRQQQLADAAKQNDGVKLAAENFSSTADELPSLDLSTVRSTTSLQASDDRFSSDRLGGWKNLRQLLTASSIKHLTLFRRMFANEHQSVITDDYRMLYFYRMSRYNDCFQLAARDIQYLMMQSRLAICMVQPPFLDLFDNEIVSVTGCLLLCFPTAREEGDYIRQCSVNQRNLAVYLILQCAIKLKLLQFIGPFRNLAFNCAMACEDRAVLDYVLLNFICKKAHLYLTGNLAA